MTALHLPRPIRRVTAPLALALAAVIIVVVAFVAVPPSNDKAVAEPGRARGGGPSVLDQASRPTASGGRAGKTAAAGPAAGVASDASASLASPVAKDFESGAVDGAAVDGGPVPGLALKVIQTASLGLRVKRGRVEDTVAVAIRAATTAGGQVVSTSLASQSGRPRSATVVLRMPAERFDRTLELLRDAGALRGLAISSQDVTEEYVDVRSRLRHDRAVEERLLLLLGKTRSVGDTLAVQERLDTVQQQIEVEQGRLNYLERLTALSTIELSVTERRKAGEPDVTKDGGVEWGIGDAFEESAERFAGNMNRAIVAFGGLLPAVLLLVALGLALRFGVRRRRAS